MTKDQRTALEAYTNRQQVISELQTSRVSFYQLLDSLSNEDFYKPSLNPGWTNGEILVHMTFGFIIVNVLLPMARLWGKLPKGSSRWFASLLNAFTGPFNWINELGARGQVKIFTRRRLGKVFDRSYFSLLRKINSIQENEWQRGMYYPTKWDPNFSEFMTVEKLFHYPVNHFNFHLTQISHGKDGQ